MAGSHVYLAEATHGCAGKSGIVDLPGSGQSLCRSPFGLVRQVSLESRRAAGDRSGQWPVAVAVADEAQEHR
jgi:hypothetical protein